MFTMEGEPMVMCEARYRMADLSELDVLDTVLERQGERTWTQPGEVDGRTWVRGSVTVEGSVLALFANSKARFEGLRQVVENALPGLSLMEERTTPAREILMSRERPLPPPAGPLPPAAAQALAAFVREQEERWVDEAVPALGGLTPRQAAADPT